MPLALIPHFIPSPDGDRKANHIFSSCLRRLNTDSTSLIWSRSGMINPVASMMFPFSLLSLNVPQNVTAGSFFFASLYLIISDFTF